MEEHRFSKALVAGSSPAGGTIFIKVCLKYLYDIRSERHQKITNQIRRRYFI
jgi:hypothetical protein